MKQFNLIRQGLLLMVLALGFSQPSFALMTSGTYTVGAGGNYADLSTAITDLNSSTITGPVVLDVIAGSYSGTAWQGQINTIAGASSTNTITIQAQSGPGTVTISAAGSASVNYIIRLNNADYITIKNLSLTNTNTTNGRVIDIAGTSSGNTVTGCILTGATGAATGEGRAIVALGTTAAPLAGSSNSITGNTMANGHSGVLVVGTASATTNTHQINNNIITEPYVYGIYASYAGAITISGNTITSTLTTCTHGMYMNYIQTGGGILNNNVTINTTSGTHYGLYNNYVNSVAAPDYTTISGNTFNVIGTSGTCYSLYNTYSNRLNILNNTFSASTTTGSTFQVTMAYYGTDVFAQGNTFTATCGTSGGLNPTTTYYFAYNGSTSNPNNIHIRDNTFNYTTSGATVGTSSSGGYFLYYPNNVKINKNRINFNMNASSTVYGMGAYYFAYYGSNLQFDSNKTTLNAPNGGTFYHHYYYWSYYTNNVSYSNDTVVGSMPTGTAYVLGYPYLISYATDARLNDNYINVTSTSATQYSFNYYPMYGCTNGQINNNRVIMNNTSGSVYNPYSVNYYNSKTKALNNTFITNASTSTVYSPYYVLYPGTGSGNKAEGNTFTYNPSSSGTCQYCPYYLNYQGSMDTVENNTWNYSSPSGGSFYTYNYYLGGLSRNNTWNINTTSGAISMGFYYGYNGIFRNNTIRATTTTGTIYGIYDQPYGSTGYGFTMIGNTWDLKSTSGTIYGYYNPSGTAVSKNTFMSNVFGMKSGTGALYMYYNPYGNFEEVKIFNNTFHGNTGGTTCQLFYQAGSSTSYPGKSYLYNNIFSRSNAATGNAVDIQDTAFCVSDNNLLYSPGTVTLRAGNPAITTTSFDTWKEGTGRDMNSLSYNPGYMDAANGDFRPDPANPNSWSVQGRGLHLAGDTLDILGNFRAKTRFDGVPDLGAYEFTPTAVPPDAVAVPSSPVANSKQVFYFGGDSVCSIEWGNTVPSSVSVKQYTGLKANVSPGITERAFFYVDVQTSAGVYEYKPRINYKDNWIGNVSSETRFRIAKSSNGGAWAGYNFHNGVTDSVRNALMPKDDFDSLSSAFTGVENARIGIRCVVPPAGMQHFDVTAFAAKETWEPVFFPIGYQVIVDTQLSPLNLSLKQFVSPPPSGSPVYPIQNLKENTIYYVSLRTICGAKDTSSWAADSFRTMITCHMPKLGSTSVTDKQAVVFWDTVQTAFKYEYVLDESRNTPSFGTMMPVNSQLAYGLKPGTWYYSHVKAYCNTIYEESGWALDSFFTNWPKNINQLGDAAGVSAYPNPVKDVLTVSLFGTPDENAHITITDVTGKLVYSAAVKESKFEISTRNLPGGMYLLKYTDDTRTDVIKINKQ